MLRTQEDEQDEQQLIAHLEKYYRKRKRAEKQHSINKMYSGEDNEQMFYNFLGTLLENKIICWCKWLSYHEKTPFDFVVQLPDATYLWFDVVGTHQVSNRTHLNTSGKNYKEKMRSIDGEGYLAFLIKDMWCFLKITPRYLPKGDISLSPGRKKHMKKIFPPICVRALDVNITHETITT